MAYKPNASVVTMPLAANDPADDLTDMAENFNLLRQFFMTGIAPVHGATIAYGYNASDECTSITFGGTLAGSAIFAYTSGELRTETWSVYSATITVTHGYDSGLLTDTSVAIT